MIKNNHETYHSTYAKYYDILCEQKDYSSETRALNKLIDSLQINETASIIDVGCGTGTHSIYLSTLRPNSITGFDKSAAMIEEANKKKSSVDFMTGSLTELRDNAYAFSFSLFNVINCLNNSTPC